MTRERLEQERDQALRDLLDLDRQVAAGELPAEVAADLRGQYERAAADALHRLAEDTSPVGEPAAARPRSRTRVLAYAVTALAAVFAAAVLLPAYLGDRGGPGRAVTGNEVFGAAGQAGATASRDPSTVSNAELEAVVNQNPNVVGMRLALAHRYLAAADYVNAARHYVVALRQDPNNPEALSHVSWIFLQTGQARQALDYVDRSLARDPGQGEALWFKANIVLYGLSDPAGALAVLEQLRARTDLTPDIRKQVDTMIAAAQQQAGGR